MIMRTLRRLHADGEMKHIEWTLSTPVLETLMTEMRPEWRFNHPDGAVHFEGFIVNEVETDDIVIHLTQIDPR
jgi:hypothetical protein